MEKMRRLTQGRLAEVMGEKAINLDKFALTVGHHKAAKLTWQKS